MLSINIDNEEIILFIQINILSPKRKKVERKFQTYFYELQALGSLLLTVLREVYTNSPVIFNFLFVLSSLEHM